MSSFPIVLRLPRRSLERKDAVRTLLGRLDPDLRGRATARAEIESVFLFKDDELAFARALAERTNLWIFRVNQKAFAGDFVVVDVSCPFPDRRPVIALDLKRGQRVREGRQGVQMKNTHRAIAALASAGLVAKTSTPVHLTGDARCVLASFGDALGRARRLARSS